MAFWVSRINFWLLNNFEAVALHHIKILDISLLERNRQARYISCAPASSASTKLLGAEHVSQSIVAAVSTVGKMVPRLADASELSTGLSEASACFAGCLSWGSFHALTISYIEMGTVKRSSSNFQLRPWRLITLNSGRPLLTIICLHHRTYENSFNVIYNKL